MAEEKVFVIDIRLSHGWVIVLSCLLVIVIFITLDVSQQRPVSATTAGTTETLSSSNRRFYLSKGLAYGSIANSECANGYHMASLWEIADPSNLKYDSDLGFTQGDAFWGPPAGEGVAHGWIHTGYTDNVSTVAGRANCNSYTSHGINQWGTIAALHSQWTSGAQDIGPWDFQTLGCSSYTRVWCIED